MLYNGENRKMKILEVFLSPSMDHPFVKLIISHQFSIFFSLGFGFLILNLTGVL